MKNSMIIFVMLLAATAIFSCERNALNLEAPLTVGKTSSIQKGEPVTFTFKTEADVHEIEWQVTPSNKVSVISMGKTARIKFGEAGSYIVTATDRINVSRSTVTVDTTTYRPTDTTTIQIPLDTVKSTGPDKPVVIPAKDTVKVNPVDTVGTNNVYLDLKNVSFTLTPTIVDTLGTAGLGLRIESNNTFPCTNSYLNFSPFFQNSQTKIFRLNLYHVVRPGAKFCQEGDRKVSVNTFIHPLSEGNNRIEITMNGNVYSGIITKNKNTFSISWPDNSVIKFSTLTLTK